MKYTCMKKTSTQVLGVGGIVSVFLLTMIGTTLTAAQTCVAPPSGLVSWWPGDGDAKDIADANHGTLQGDATFATGFVGQAFSFNGAGEVRVPDAANLNVQTTFALDAWVFPTYVNTLDVDIIINKELRDGVTDTIQYEIGRKGYVSSGIIPLGNLAFFIGGIGGLPNHYSGWVDGGGSLPLNTWTHVALAFDGSSVKTYVNGLLKKHYTGLTGSVNVSSGPLKIGSRNDFVITKLGQGHARWNGLIDESEIFNRALTAEEILAIYNAGPHGKCKVLTVGIDIKPGSYPNSINLSSAGTVPVAILSSATFNATEVDPATVTLEGAAVKLKGKSDNYMCGAEDVNKDGLMDLICHVITNQLELQIGDSEGVLDGKTFSGQAIRGKDSINIVKD